MPSPISNDLRKRIIMSIKKGESVKEVAQRYDVSQSMVYRLLRLYKETGSYEPRENLNGRKPKLSKRELKLIENKMGEKPDITLNELIEELNLNISNSRLCRIINEKLKLKRKKNSFSKGTKSSRC